MANQIGPQMAVQLRRLRSVWEQGEHVVISGSTGSGKTALGRTIDELRIDAGGAVVMFVCKTGNDKTVLQDYKGWTRWKTWKRNPSRHDNKILLWPDISKTKTLDEVKMVHREVFRDALNRIARVGKWCVDLDEGLYINSPEFMGLKNEVAMLHALGRSDGITMITKMQRPSNVPLITYGSASHAFIGSTKERSDLQRLSELGGRHTAKELAGRISQQGRHDFLWLPITPGWEPETVNLRR